MSKKEGGREEKAIETVSTQEASLHQSQEGVLVVPALSCLLRMRWRGG
jgi:hypothetical protein